MSGSHQARSVAVPHVQATLQKQTIGPVEAHSWKDPDEEDEGARPGLAIDGDGAGGEGSAGQ